VTQNNLGFQLYLNGHLQFNSTDEYRYHEALVHPPMSSHPAPRRVLVLGGGDGLAVREILRHPDIESVTLVDLDPAMTGLSERFAPLNDLNQAALRDHRVTVINADAFLWVSDQHEPFDVAIVDFPDPGNFSIGKLYTRLFFRNLRECLSDSAVIAVQCTSPLVAPMSYWCIIRTIEDAGYNTFPYRASVPTFGVWGFVMATPSSSSSGGLASNISDGLQIPPTVATELRYLNSAMMESMFQLPADMGRVPTEINLLNNQVLVRYYEEEWGRWN